METWHDNEARSPRTPRRLSDSYRLPVFRRDVSAQDFGDGLWSAHGWLRSMASLEDVDRSLLSSFLFCSLKRENAFLFLSSLAATPGINPVLVCHRMINLVPSPRPVDMSRLSESEPR